MDFEDIKKEDATPLIDTSEVAVVDDALRNAGGGGGAQVSSGNPFDSFTGAIQPPPSSTSLTAPPQTATTTAASASLSLEGLKIDFREGQTRPTSTSDPLSIHDGKLLSRHGFNGSRSTSPLTPVPFLLDVPDDGDNDRF